MIDGFRSQISYSRKVRLRAMMATRKELDVIRGVFLHKGPITPILCLSMNTIGQLWAFHVEKKSEDALIKLVIDIRGANGSDTLLHQCASKRFEENRMQFAL